MLYFAYGSNLNLRQMRVRCPAAKPIGRFYLTDARLVFRGVADCIAEPGSTCPGGIWKITRRCEDALDQYEGVDGGLYRKEYVEITGMPGEDRLMLYQMNSTGIMPPSQYYLDSIKEGYANFKLPLAPLFAAVEQSRQDKELTFHERARRHRTGYAAFAKPEPKQTGKAGTGKRHAKKKMRSRKCK